MKQHELDDQIVASVPDRLPLTLRTADEWDIVIEADPMLSGVTDSTLVLDGESPATAALASTHLSGRRITTASIDGGSLRLVFDGGLEVTVHPDPDFEAWQINGPAGQLIVCTPGGELAAWGAENTA